MSALRDALTSLTAGERWTAFLAVTLGAAVLLFGTPGAAPRLAPTSLSAAPQRAGPEVSASGTSVVDGALPPAIGATAPLDYLDEIAALPEGPTTTSASPTTAPTTAPTTTTTSPSGPPVACANPPLGIDTFDSLLCALFAMLPLP